MQMRTEADCTVIIPVYNVEKYLSRCIDSLLDQNVFPRYILLIDDGSSDHSPEICDDYADKNDSIFAFHKPNGGVSGARNYGLDLVENRYRTTFVCFVDPDDSVDPHFVETLVQNMHDADLAICGYQKVIMNDRMMLDVETINDGVVKEGANLAQKLCVLHRNTLLFMCWNKCFRLKIISENHIRFPELRRLEDASFVYRYLCFSNDVVFLQECLYMYSVFVKGRVTATTDFLGELCKGQFNLYKSGADLLEHLKKMKIPKSDVESFQIRLEQHLDSGVFGEIVNSVPASKLSLKERKKYIVDLLNQYKEMDIHPAKRSEDAATKIVKYLYLLRAFTCIAIFTYGIDAIKTLKNLRYLRGQYGS